MRVKKKTDENMNYGVRLYQKGVKKQEEKDRICKEIQIEREANERQQYSYRPQINPVSAKFGRQT